MNQPLHLDLAFQAPSFRNWLGYDPFGVELSHRIAEGAFFSISTSLVSSFISVGIAVCVSILQVYSPTPVASIFHKFVDGLLAFPGLLLAILFAVLLPPSNLTVVSILTLTSWAGSSKIFHGILTKSLHDEYVEASQAFGATKFWIFKTHLFKRLLPFVSLQFIFIFLGTLLAESSLSFLGLGSPLDSPSWGRLIAQGRQYLIEAPHLSVFPGISLILTLLSLQILGKYFQNSRIFTKIR